jgi:TonB family protein
MKQLFVLLFFFLAAMLRVSAQEITELFESCSVEEAWNGDTSAIHKFVRKCGGKVDTISYDENNNISKTKIHHQTIKMTLNSGRVVHEDSVYFIADQMPQFPGGDNELLEFITKNIHYPATARTKKIQGRVYIQFVVERDGSVRRAKIIKRIGGGCDEEALRVVQAMPKWSPGKVHGTPVQVQFTLPVKFSL